MRLDYEIRNLSGDRMDFLWKIHAAFEVNDGCSIEIPSRLAKVDPRFQHLFEGSSYDWPLATLRGGARVDMSRVRTSDHSCTCQYLTELEEGTVGLRDEGRGLESRLTFPKDVLDNVWLFLDYGGWRGNYLAALEPSTGYPQDLAEAIRQRHCASLDGGGTLRAQVGFSVGPIGARPRSNA
jgi:hypothetical protein